MKVSVVNDNIFIKMECIGKGMLWGMLWKKQSFYFDRSSVGFKRKPKELVLLETSISFSNAMWVVEDLFDQEKWKKKTLN